jgi:hypothetical protein
MQRATVFNIDMATLKSQRQCLINEKKQQITTFKEQFQISIVKFNGNNMMGLFKRKRYMNN